MFFISTQPRFIRGVVLPWVVSFLKTNLIMPLRKFYLKIHVETCCSQPRPADSWEGLHSTVAAAQSTQPHLPSPQSRQWGFSLSVATPPMTWESSQRPMTSARSPRGLLTVAWYQDSWRGGAGACGRRPAPQRLIQLSFRLEFSLEYGALRAWFSLWSRRGQNTIPKWGSIPEWVHSGFHFQDWVLLNQAWVSLRL